MYLDMSNEIPDAEEFINLRVIAGLSKRDIEGIKIGLKNSNHIVTFRENKKLVGMGRIIGDGATTFQIVDIAVLPEYQGKGIGKKIMENLMDYLEKNAAPNSYVSLIGDGNAVKLYEKFGFRSTAPKSLGMYKFIKKD